MYNIGFGLSDAHTHLYELDRLDDFLAKMDAVGYERFALLSAASYFPDKCASGNMLALLVKLRRAGRAYGFAAFDQPDRGVSSADELAEQAEWMVAMGFDGLKMMEGKPNYRNRVGEPLDSDVFEKAYAVIERAGLPTLIHVNDPRYFWDINKCSQNAIKMGWYAPPGSATFEQVRAEAVRAAEKHPGTRFVFAHFFFASDDIDYAARLLDSHANICFDLAPGMMVEDFARSRAAWREFLEKYSDRVLFGTDHYEGTEASYTDELMRFYATEDDMTYRGETIRGLGLSQAALSKIAGSNIRAFAGDAPKSVNAARLSEYADFLLSHIGRNAAREKIASDVRAMEKACLSCVQGAV